MKKQKVKNYFATPARMLLLTSRLLALPAARNRLHHVKIETGHLQYFCGDIMNMLKHKYCQHERPRAARVEFFCIPQRDSEDECNAGSQEFLLLLGQGDILRESFLKFLLAICTATHRPTYINIAGIRCTPMDMYARYSKSSDLVNNEVPF